MTETVTFLRQPKFSVKDKRYTVIIVQLHCPFAAFQDDAASAGQFIAEGASSQADFNTYDMSQIKTSMNVTESTSQEQASQTYEGFRNEAAKVGHHVIFSFFNNCLLLFGSSMSYLAEGQMNIHISIWGQHPPICLIIIVQSLTERFYTSRGTNHKPFIFYFSS